jgi:hypothetical protein
VTTSGSADHTNTRNEIIESALRKMGQLAEGEPVTAQQIRDASGDLERLVKAWQAQGIHLWKYEELVLFLVAGQQSYALGPTGDRIVKKDDLTTSALSVDAVISATSITVSSATGISSGDNIGVVIDDNTIHWTTVNGAPAGSVVTLTTGLDGAASSGNKVYVFTTKAPRPLQITQGRTQIDTTNEIEMTIQGREDYFALPNKSASDTPLNIFYNPTLTNGKLYVWPTASDERQFLNLTAKMPIEDFDAAGNNPDFPQEWHQALIWGLCAETYTEYGTIDPTTVAKIEKQADKWFSIVSDFDVEEADIVVMPDFSS